MKMRNMCVLLSGLLSLVITAAGCDTFSKKEVGMVIVYEIVPDDDSPDVKPSESDIDKTVAALQRRLSPGIEWGGVRKLPDGRVEARIYWDRPERMESRAKMLPRPGTMEFRILANRLDHKALIDRAEAEPDSKELRDTDGKREAWWVPVQEGADPKVVEDKQIATRTRKEGNREVTEVLVVKDPYDVTGTHVKEARSGFDERGQPCVNVLFSSEGAKLLSGLTGSNLPDATTGVERRLGIVLDGKLLMAPGVRSTISRHAEINGNFTEEEVQELANLLNSGSLPFPIHEVSRRKVAPGEELPE